MSTNKQIRCINCNNIIAKGHIKEGIVVIDCRHCKTSNIIEAVKPDSVPYGERREFVIKGEDLRLAITNTKREKLGLGKR